MKFWLKVWEKIDINKVKNNLLVIGAYKAECFNCHNIDIDKDKAKCPYCGAEFKYVAFREHFPGTKELNSLKERECVVIDWQVFKKEIDRQKAKEILG